jgi:DNA invertase Pin-like site-specific DNA recombinase
MLIGYARVSTNDQETTAQVSALKAAGCERNFREKASGGRWARPELHRILDQLRKDDVLVVWKLDRLSRSLRDVLTIMERLTEEKAGFRSLTEAIDTTTPAGRMMLQMLGAFAEFERAMLRERTKAGLESARREGRIGGRPVKLNVSQRQEIVRFVLKGAKSAADAARLFSSSSSDGFTADISGAVSSREIKGDWQTPEARITSRRPPNLIQWFDIGTSTLHRISRSMALICAQCPISLFVRLRSNSERVPGVTQCFWSLLGCSDALTFDASGMYARQ